MKYAITAILLLFSVAAFGQLDQFRMVGSGSWSVVDDSTYSATVTFASDLTANSFLPTGVVDSMRVFTQRGQLYTIDSVGAKTFSTAVIYAVEYGGDWGSPSGQVLVYETRGRETVPAIPFATNGATSKLQEAVVTHNAAINNGVSTTQLADSTTAAKTYTNNQIASVAPVKDTIVQASHGFSVGDPIWYSGDYLLSLDTGLTVRVDGIISEVPDVNTFVLQRTGRFALTSHGFSVGVQLYVQPDGSYSATDTSNALVYGHPLDANTIEIGLKDDQVGIIAEKFNSGFSGLPQYKSQAIDTLSRIQSIEDVNSLFAQKLRFTEDQKIFVKETGATYQVKSTAPISEDSISVINRGDGTYLVLDAPDYVDIRWFGAESVVEVFNRKNPIINSAEPSVDKDAYTAIKKAMNFALATGKVGADDRTTSNREVRVIGHYYIKDSTINIPPGIDFICKNNSSINFGSGFLDTAIVIDGHFGANHRLNITRNSFGNGTTNGQDWYAKNTDTVAVDSTSVGVLVTSSQFNNIYIENIRNFQVGLETRGKEATGVTENQFYINQILGSRYGIKSGDDIESGWSHQNRYIGGRVKNLGTPSRNYAIDIDCSHLKINSDNNTFQDINMEGSTFLKYAVDITKSSNIFINCRFEGVTAGQLRFSDVAYDCKIMGSYGKTMLENFSDLGRYWSSDGTEPNIPTDVNGNTVKGSIYGGNIKPDIITSNSISLPGGASSSSASQFSGYNSTLRLGNKQTGNTKDYFLSLVNSGERPLYYIDGLGNFHWYGDVSRGKSWELEATERGQVGLPSYTTGVWYSENQVIEDGGTSYYVKQPFQASGTIGDDVTAGYLASDATGVDNPYWKLNASNLTMETERIGGIDNGTKQDVPELRNGVAWRFYSDNVINISSLYTLSTEGLSHASFNNSTSSPVEVRFSTTNYTSGQTFFISVDKNSTGGIFISPSSSRRTPGADTLWLNQHDLAMCHVGNYSGNIFINIQPFGAISQSTKVTNPKGGDNTVQSSIDSLAIEYRNFIPIPYNAVDTIVVDTINTAFAITPDIDATDLKQVTYTTDAQVTGDLTIRLLYRDVSAGTYTAIGSGTITTGNNQVTVSGLTQTVTSGDFIYPEVTASDGGGLGTTPANGLHVNLKFQ